MIESNRRIKNEESLPYLDDEKNNINVNESYNSNEKIISNDNDNSPTIIKITKKKGNQNMYSSYVNSPSNHNFKILQQNEIKQRNKDNFYNNQNNNRFSQTIPIP